MWTWRCWATTGGGGYTAELSDRPGIRMHTASEVGVASLSVNRSFAVQFVIALQILFVKRLPGVTYKTRNTASADQHRSATGRNPRARLGQVTGQLNVPPTPSCCTATSRRTHDRTCGFPEPTGNARGRCRR